MAKVIQALGKYGKKAIDWAWAHKGQILNWLNAGQTVEWIVNKIKGILGL